MATGSGGAPSSAGTTDIKVQRIEEGIPALATVSNPSANPPTINTFDAGKAAGADAVTAVAQIDTTETSRLAPSALVKRGAPSKW